MTASTRRRPRSITCPTCNGRMVLIDCGVPEHRRTRTRREQIDGRCPGTVYSHVGTGGMDCDYGPVDR